MRTALFSLLLLALFIIINTANAQVPDNRILEPTTMQQDFKYLRSALENTHPGLYMHYSKEDMQAKLDSLYRLLDKPLPFFHFYKIISYVIAEIKCEHTYCNPYGNNFKDIAGQWKVVPVQPYFLNNKAYVVVNLTEDTTIHLGDEILAINHHPIDSIVQELYKYVPADGNMTASKERFLSSTAFNISYYEFIERPGAFDITFKNTEGQTFERRFDTGLTFLECEKSALKNPANRDILAIDKKNKIQATNPWRLQLSDDKKTAFMTIRTFTGNRKKLFKKYDHFFTILQKQKVNNLIIDISYNGGGDEEYAAELLSYLISKPTSFIAEEYLKTDSDFYLKQTNIPQNILKNKYAYIYPLKNGKAVAKAQTEYTRELKVFQPKPNRFKGNVYFYINGGTSSAASTFAAVAQSNALGVFIGEETSGSFAGGGTTNGLELTLPNSKITTHTSVVYQSFATAGRDKDRGVIPDYSFIPTFKDLVTANDGWKKFILNLIGK